MTSFVQDLRKVLIAGFALALAGALLSVLEIGGFYGLIHYPFYSYDKLESYLLNLHSQHGNKIAQMVGNDSIVEQDSYLLYSGKAYCAAKVFNQHITVKNITRNINNFPPESDSISQNVKMIDSIFHEADEHLCPCKSKV